MDTYIDNPETQKYGPKLTANLVAAFAGSADQVKAFVHYLVQHQEEQNLAMQVAMDASRGATSTLGEAAAVKSPAVGAAKSLLSGVLKHLQGETTLGDWSGDIALYFPNGAAGFGESAHDVMNSLHTVLAALDKDTTLARGSEFKKRIKAAEKALQAEIDKTTEALSAQRTGLSEQGAEKKSWLRSYRGIALIVEGLLTMEGRQSQLATVVPHLSVPDTKKPKKPEPTP